MPRFEWIGRIFSIIRCCLVNYDSFRQSTNDWFTNTSIFDQMILVPLFLKCVWSQLMDAMFKQIWIPVIYLNSIVYQTKCFYNLPAIPSQSARLIA